ncbi:hypothetical protein [Streptomyces luteocolor]|uniref:hypothetical protein n=1 Tax=Streptomyces luteocolor TaxID=285500 RepID=UPI0013017D8F|nr:hypothetical protein [Streptomyces luteocolor]
MTAPIRWTPDERSAKILAAFASHRETRDSVLRRALELLARADGIVDSRGRIKTSGRRT